jgi:hypothetical protein
LISRKNRISFARVKESFSGLYPKVEPPSARGKGVDGKERDLDLGNKVRALR